jgi:hypothetical protein
MMFCALSMLAGFGLGFALRLWIDRRDERASMPPDEALRMLAETLARAPRQPDDPGKPPERTTP